MKQLQLLCCGVFVLAASASAQEQNVSREQFKVKPNKCIALHRGQVCYQKLRFKWKNTDQRELCIIRQSDQQEIVCWLGQEKSQHDYKFSSVKEETFFLREKGSEENLGQVHIKVAWVYRKGKKSSSGWRLF